MKHIGRIYSILPGLVTIESNTNHLPDFLLSQNLSFFSTSGQASLHYKVFFGDSIQIPKVWDARIGNYVMNGSRIFYNRSLIGELGFRFSYDMKTRTFCFNPLYRYHHVNIGDIFTIGRHLFHAIEVDLAIHDLFILLGAVVSKRDNTPVFLAPNGNEKTTFVNGAIDRGYAYVAENFFAIDIHSHKIYGVGPMLSNKKRIQNEILRKKFATSRVKVQNSVKPTAWYLLTHHQKKTDRRNLVYNYVDTYAKYYKKNNFIRSILYWHLGNPQLERKYEALCDFLEKRVIPIHSLADIHL